MSRFGMILGLFLLGASQAAIAAEPKLPSLAIDSYVLPNGLKVVLHRDPSIPQVTVCVAYHVGSKNERAGRTGFAHFFEHMMFRGTKNVPNFDVPLQETGAQSNAFTSEDMTVYYETVASVFLERAIYLEAERLAFLPSALAQETFDTEREVVKNERRQSYENQPYGLSEEAILGALFPKGHPYSWSVIGSMKDLNAASLKDLRQFFAEFYTPSNATLCLSGDFDISQAKSWISKYFAPLASGTPPQPVKAAPFKVEPKRLTLKDKISLPRVYWNWSAVADDHPDSAALDLLSIVLSSGEASRLYRALVRDAKVAKDVTADLDSKEIAGLFQIRATAAEGKKLVDLEAEIQKVLDDLKVHPPTKSELDRALARFETAAYEGLTDNRSRAFQLAIGFSQKGDPNYYRDELRRYFQVTKEDLARVAQTYLTPEKLVLEIVPASKGEAKSEAVLMGPLPSDQPDPTIADRVPAAGPDWSNLPGPSSPQPFKGPKIVRRMLSNGIDVWVAPWKTLPLVSAELIVPVGTADSPEGKAGAALLLGAILDKGTKDKTSTELTEAFEILGTSPSVAVSPDNTVYSWNCLARNLRPILEQITPMIQSPRFDPADFVRERSLQKAVLIQSADNPTAIARRAFRPLLYGTKHPYGQPDEGTLASLDRLTLDDLKAFHKSHFGPADATLVIAGDVEPDAVFQSLESTIGTWKNETKAPEPRPAVAQKAEPGVVHLVDKPGAVQSVLMLGRPWTGRDDPRYFAEIIANHTVGEDFLSRLNANLREKNGYSYGIGSRFGFRRNSGTWQIFTSVRTDVTAPALKEVLSELNGLLKQRPLSAEEIATARDAIGRAFPEELENPTSIASSLAELAIYKLPQDGLDTYLASLAKPSVAEIQKVIAEIANPQELLILVVGDRAAVEAKLKAVPGVTSVRIVDIDGKPVPAH